MWSLTYLICSVSFGASACVYLRSFVLRKEWFALVMAALNACVSLACLSASYVFAGKA